jgi:hypothetical protein
MAAVVWLAAACASNPTTFDLTSASVDPQYSCPEGAKDAPYDLHATIAAHNGTSSTVSIKSIATEMTLTAVKGSWLEKVGDRYEAESVKFEPSSIAAGSSATIKITIPSSCTSGTHGSNPSGSGEYRVTLRVTTSAGVHAISASNQHQILAA